MRSLVISSVVYFGKSSWLKLHRADVTLSGATRQQVIKNELYFDCLQCSAGDDSTDLRKNAQIKEDATCILQAYLSTPSKPLPNVRRVLLRINY